MSSADYNSSDEERSMAVNARRRAQGRKGDVDGPKPSRRPHKVREYKTYNYDALPRRRGAIRLLNLYSSEKPDAGVLCELITPKEDQKDHYRYEALSWCWGTEAKTDYIRVQRKGKTYAKYVSPNLVAAMKALRHPTRSRYLWIDMVCIDQENLNEKNHQVEMMDEIYGNADRVCIWLGEANDSSRMALEFIKREVSHLQSFDTLCESKDASKKWVALLDLMQRPWFSRRWVVQEIALARKAVIYCGQDKISWKKFAIAVELFVEVETATHRLSEVMKKDRQYRYIPSYFEFVSALGASLLVDATERLFRDYKEEQIVHSDVSSDTETESDSDSSSEESGCESTTLKPPIVAEARKDPLIIPKSRIQPLLSLEYLVSSLTIFDTTVPHDTIYALLAIAKDTTPRAVRTGAGDSSEQAHDGLEVFTQRKRYNVDYKLPYVDVCKEFILFSIVRSLQSDRSRALDVICRPWATEERVLAAIRDEKVRSKEKRDREEKRKREREQRRPAKGQKVTSLPARPALRSRLDQSQSKLVVSSDIFSQRKVTADEDMPLPSWVPQLSRASYAMSHRPGLAGPKMSRINADPLVGLPSLTHRNYSAAETKGVDMKALKFRKRTELGHFSMYVRGFLLDRVKEVEQVARNGQIPREWAQLGGWPTAKGHPPDAFWRTLVADRGKDGKNPPVYYSRACEESFKKGGLESGAVDTTALIDYERNSVVAQFCRRVQAVTWNRALVRTEGGRLGLVGKDVEKGDLVCILYGCSVPVILRESERKSPHDFNREEEWELKFVANTASECYKRYAARKKRHELRKDLGMLPFMRQWFKSSDWLRKNGWTRECYDGNIRIDDLQTWSELIASTTPLKELVRSALEAFSDWRQIERRRAWREHLRKQEQEAEDAKNVQRKHGKDQMDDILRKRKTQELQAQRKRRKSRGIFDLDFVPSPTTITPAVTIPNGVVKDTSTIAKKKKAPIDWWAFEYALVAGRRWRRIVKERKEARFKYGEEGTEVSWQQKRREKCRAFEERRRAEGKWVEKVDTWSNGALIGPALPPSGRADSPTEPDPQSVVQTPSPAIPLQIRPSWNRKKNTDRLSKEEGKAYQKAICDNLHNRLGEEGNFSYKLLGECYVHGMMDGEAMLYQNEGDEEVIPSMVFEIR